MNPLITTATTTTTNNNNMLQQPILPITQTLFPQHHDIPTIQQQQMLFQQQQQQQPPQQSTSPFFNKLKRRMDADDNDGYHFQSNKKFLSQNLANKIGFLSLSDNEVASTSASISPPLNAFNSNYPNNNSFNVPQMDINNNSNINNPFSTYTSNISTNTNNNNNIIPFSTIQTQTQIPTFNDNNNNKNNNLDTTMKTNNNNGSSALAIIPVSNNNNINNGYKSKSSSDLLGSLTNKYKANEFNEIDLKEKIMNFSKIETIKPINIPSTVIPPSILKSPENKSTAIILYSEPSEVISGSLRKEIAEKRKQLIEKKENQSNNKNNNYNNSNKAVVVPAIQSITRPFSRLQQSPSSSSNIATPPPIDEEMRLDDTFESMKS